MMIRGIKMEKHANTKIDFKGYEISIAMDDSCGKMKNYDRTDIRIYKNDIDVTNLFCLENEILTSSQDLFDVMSKINNQ